MGKSKESEHSCGLVVDRISQLPDNVIDNILIHLPIVEAARTCVLSRNWKRVWRNISVLVFDSSFGNKFKKASQPNLMLVIYRTLLLHLGEIDGFTLSIPWLESCNEIDSMIQFLSEKKIKHLKIQFKKGDFHILPSYLFSCFHLSTLDLALCKFNPPRSFGGFRKLITLVLKRVDIDKDVFEMLFSKCPLLEHVELRKCCFGEASSIDIIAPNLRTFLYKSCKLIIYFVSAPLLDELDLCESGHECRVGKLLNYDTLKKLHLDELCTAAPGLRILDIDDVYLKFLKAPLSSQPPNCFQQLKELYLYCFRLTDLDQVISLLGLIRRSPNLELFSAQLDCDDTVRVLSISFFQYLGHDVSCNRLQRVELSDFNGTYPEMDFVKFLLSKSPQLKTITIRQASKDDHKGLQILRKVIRFRRASAVVDIIFCNGDEDEDADEDEYEYEVEAEADEDADEDEYEYEVEAEAE